MSLKTPDKIRTFQRKLYLKAKAEAAQDAVTGIRRFPSERVFGELDVLLPRPKKTAACCVQ